jgi:hypothetical protein
MVSTHLKHVCHGGYRSKEAFNTAYTIYFSIKPWNLKTWGWKILFLSNMSSPMLNWASREKNATPIHPVEIDDFPDYQTSTNAMFDYGSGCFFKRNQQMSSPKCPAPQPCVTVFDSKRLFLSKELLELTLRQWHFLMQGEAVGAGWNLSRSWDGLKLTISKDWLIPFKCVFFSKIRLIPFYAPCLWGALGCFLIFQDWIMDVSCLVYGGGHSL